MKFFVWLRQLLCVHDFEVEDGQDLVFGRMDPWFVCKKCSKRERGV